MFPSRLVRAPEELEAVLVTGKVEADEKRILMLAGRFPNILNIPDAGRS